MKEGQVFYPSFLFNNMIQALQKILPFNYKGLLVYKTKNGYKWGNKEFETLKKLDDSIDDILKKLKKSII